MSARALMTAFDSLACEGHKDERFRGKTVLSFVVAPGTELRLNDQCVIVSPADSAALDAIFARADAAFSHGAHDAEFNALVELYRWVDANLRAEDL